MRPARLAVYQSPRNPNPRERRILTLLAEGHTQKEAAHHLGIRSRAVTNTIATMRSRYTAPTNEALIALAVRLQWITLSINCAEYNAQPTCDEKPTIPTHSAFALAPESRAHHCGGRCGCPASWRHTCCRTSPEPS